MTIFSTIPLLGYASAFFWLFAIAVTKTTKPKEMVLAGLMTVGGVLFIHEYFVLTVVLTKTATVGMTIWETLTDASFRAIALLYLAGSVAYIVLVLIVSRLNIRLGGRVARGLLAVILLNLVISVGGYYWNYMLYSITALRKAPDGRG